MSSQIETDTKMPRNQFPPDFGNWPLDAQIQWVEMSMSRKGLIRRMLSMAGVEADEFGNEIRDDTKLSKQRLAAIHIALRGTEGYPPTFPEWEHQRQIDWVAGSMTRIGMIRAMLSMAGLGPDEFELAKDTKLTKELLAAIYLTMEGFNDAR